MNETDKERTEENLVMSENKSLKNKANIKKTHNNLVEQKSIKKKATYNENKYNINTTKNNLPTNVSMQNKKKEEKEKKVSKKQKVYNFGKFLENNLTNQNIIDSALQSQLSKMNVKLLDFDLEKLENKKETGEKRKILPKIDLIEYTLLNEGDGISEFKQFGFGIYVFFFIFNKSFNNFWVVVYFCFSIHVLYFF